MGVEQTELKQPNRFHFAAKLEKQERQWVIVVTSSSADFDKWVPRDVRRELGAGRAVQGEHDTCRRQRQAQQGGRR